MPANDPQLTDGTRLKELLKIHGYTASDVAKVMAISEAGVYYYFGQEKIKRKTIAEILKKLNIPITEYYGEGSNVSEDDQYIYGGGSYHHGQNLEKIINQKGINIGRLALECNISRQTMYRYFLQKELDEGFLLLVAEKIGVHVAEIKGLGKGQKSFEKDIYNILSKLSEQIQLLQTDVSRIAKVTGA